MLGKRIGSTQYFHREHAPGWASKLEQEARIRTGVQFSYNLIKIDTSTGTVTFLKYRRFRMDPFPELECSCKVFPDDRESKVIRYKRDNPPVLHRKELLLPDNDPLARKAARLTARCEKAGLFNDTKRIGRKKVWQRMLKEAGL